jgi:hypothetical protein
VAVVGLATRRGADQAGGAGPGTADDGGRRLDSAADPFGEGRKAGAIRKRGDHEELLPAPAAGEIDLPH